MTTLVSDTISSGTTNSTTLNVLGASTLTGAVTAAGTLGVTGAVTAAGTLAVAGILSNPPSLFNLTVGAVTGTPVTLVANTLNTTDHTGTAARVVVLPAAASGVRVGYCWPADTGAGTETCTFDCAGTDAYETGTIIESRAGGVASFDTSAAGETQLLYTGAGAATNFISFGSIILFSCTTAGLWHVTLMAKSNPASTGVTGVMAFAV